MLVIMEDSCFVHDVHGSEIVVCLLVSCSPCEVHNRESCTVMGTTVYCGNGNNTIYFTAVVTAIGANITVIPC